jgi:pimeloyl-ACP methyl ester carboxylesterase
MSTTAIDRRETARVREVYVHESGTGGSPAVVFNHGGGPSGAMWRDHMDRLGSQFHCLAPDLPGFGRSNRLAPISLSETADLVAELIAARVPARRAHIVGLSYGGSVVLALLDRHPEVLDRVVIDGACVLPRRVDRLIMAGVTVVSPIVNTSLAAAFLSLVGLRDLGVALRSASPAAFRRSWREGYTAPISRAALEVVCPTLLVAGEREHSRASNAALAALMPHATARFVPGLGHAWFIQRRELHIRMVEAWLSDDALPAGLMPEPPSPSAVDRVLHQLQGRRPDANDRSGWQPRLGRDPGRRGHGGHHRLARRAGDRTGGVDRTGLIRR